MKTRNKTRAVLEGQLEEALARTALAERKMFSARQEWEREFFGAETLKKALDSLPQRKVVKKKPTPAVATQAREVTI